MTYFIISGEASGDMHGAALVKALSTVDSNALFVGMGGNMMQAAGCRLVRHIEDMAFMGVLAVMGNLRKIRENFRIAKAELLLTNPDVLVLIDYPSFNLKIASFAKKHLPKTKLVYYIPPKIWAWKTWRIDKIASLTDLVLGIFPFEPQFYQKYGYRAVYVGNPTNEAIRSVQPKAYSEKPYIAVLPGSRKHEVEHCLLKMTEAALRQEGFSVVVAAVSSVPQDVYDKIIVKLSDAGRVKIVRDDTYSVVRGAAAAIVNSGTATLETALLGCPEIAVYHLRIGPLLYQLKPLVFKIPYFTLVNIILGREVISEWLAYRFTTDNVAADLADLLVNSERRARMLADYRQLSEILGDRPAAHVAAEHIVGLLQDR